jgi:hypothetical protein
VITTGFSSTAAEVAEGVARYAVAPDNVDLSTTYSETLLAKA